MNTTQLSLFIWLYANSNRNTEPTTTYYYKPKTRPRWNKRSKAFLRKHKDHK